LLTTTSSNGHAGNITVNTPNLQLSGATSGLFAGTTSAGGAGSLTIQPRGNGQNVRVSLQDGAQISASTSSQGQGGALAIAAPGSITLTGNGSIITAGTESGGAGGNLNLRTGTLNIQNQAQVTVSSSGTGRAGSLFVDADRIYLSNQGQHSSRYYWWWWEYQLCDRPSSSYAMAATSQPMRLESTSPAAILRLIPAFSLGWQTKIVTSVPTLRTFGVVMFASMPFPSSV
jgi:hypothetical protein